MAYESNVKQLLFRRTKIVATLGPASDSEAGIRALIQAGANVFRLNMSHGDHRSHARTHARVRKIATELDQPVAIMADLCGPKIRVGTFPGGGIELINGEQVTITVRRVEGAPGLIPSQYPGLADDVRIGQRIFLADGVMALEVLAIDGPDVSCRITAGGQLTDRKGINLPDSEVSAPCLTEKDRVDAVFALDMEVEFLALSFVRQASDIRELKSLMDQHSGTAQIVAKIERPEALHNIDAILDEADAIMVARGDLGVELPPEFVPVAQTQLLDRARARHKPAIVATQMLESMIENPRPTRAEVTDISHSVTCGADAIMLSGESAAGNHPVAAVEMMDKVARQTEAYLWQQGQFISLRQESGESAPIPFGQALGRATAQLSRDLMARAIFVVTRRGQSAAEVCAARPAAPVVVLASSESLRRSLNLLWGAVPVTVSEQALEDPVSTVRELAVAMGLARKGHSVLLLQGFHHQPDRNQPSATLIEI